MVLNKEDVLTKLPQLEPYYKEVGEFINKGNSLIVDGNGEVLAGPLRSEEGILMAEIDLHILRGSKWNLDTAEHYVRPDAFELTVRKDTHPIIREEENV